MAACACIGVFIWLIQSYNVTVSAYGPPIVTKPQPRLPNYGPWCVFQFNESHVGWSANQPPQEWTRIFVPVCSSAHAIQITPYDANGIVSEGGLKMHLFEAYASYDVLYIGVEYWGPPFTLYVGYKVDPGFFSNPYAEVVCNSAIYNGVPPS